MTRFFNNFFILLVALLFILGVVIPSLAAKETKPILILYSQEKEHPAHHLIQQGIRAAFRLNRVFEGQLCANGGESRLGRVQFWRSQFDIAERRQAEQQILHYQKPILEKIET